MQSNFESSLNASTSATRPASTTFVRLSEVVSSLSYALDLTEGQPAGHAVRTCLIGMKLASELHLPASDRSDLFYALLLKDLGCSSNASDVCKFFDADDRIVKQRLKLVDWSSDLQSLRYLAGNVSPDSGPVRRTVILAKRVVQAPSAGRAFIQTRCDRGAEIARILGLSDSTADTIRNLDEHFDGCGQPSGVKGANIPLLARIAGLAQTVDVFVTEHGVSAALEMARARSGRWFDPELVEAFSKFAGDASFWQSLEGSDALAAACLLEPGDKVVLAADETLDRITEGFAKVIDAKSPWTFRHSTGVAALAVGIGEALGLDEEAMRQLRRGALLHDIGKLGVSSRVLDKPGALDDDERRQMRDHAVFSGQILERVSPFRDLAAWASAHHERLDGRGYPSGLKGDQIRRETRILTVADICQAMSEERPYRAAQPRDAALKVLRAEIGKGVCGQCVEALEAHLAKIE